MKQKPTPPTELVPTLPQALEEVILKLLEKDPEDRFQTGEDVARSLERVAGAPLLSALRSLRSPAPSL